MVAENKDSRNENLSTHSAEEDVHENKGANFIIEEKLTKCHELKISEQKFKTLEREISDFCSSSVVEKQPKNLTKVFVNSDQKTKSPEISKTMGNNNFREITAIVEPTDELLDQEYLRKFEKWVAKSCFKTIKNGPENRIFVIFTFQSRNRLMKI